MQIVTSQHFGRFEIGESGYIAAFPSSPFWNLKTDENNNRAWIDPYHLAFLYRLGEAGVKLPDLTKLEVFPGSFEFPE